MPDLFPSLSSSSSSFPEDRSPTEVWDALCRLLDVEAPSQVVSRVLSVYQHVHGNDDESTGFEGSLSPLEETEAVLHRMRDHLHTLRESNESLVEQLDADDLPEIEDSRKQLEALIDLVDADSFEATMRQVESLQQQVDALYEEKERLVAAGFASADEALNEIDRLTDECEALRNRPDTSARSITGDTNHDGPPPDLHVDRPAAASSDHAPTPGSSPTSPPDTSDNASDNASDTDASSSADESSSDELLTVLGDAIAHANRVFYDHLDEDDNDEVRASLSEISLDEQADQLRDYADQLRTMWLSIVDPAQKIVQEARSTLGMTSIGDFEAVANHAAELTSVTAGLYDATAPHLPDIPSDADPLPDGPAMAQLQATTSRLQTLHKAAQSANAFANATSGGLDPKIGEILGVSTAEEARDMMQIVQHMATRLDRHESRSQKQDNTLTTLFQQHVLVDAEALAHLSTLLGHDTPPTTPVAEHQANQAVLHPLNEHLHTLVDRGADTLERSSAPSGISQESTPTTLPGVLDAFQERIEAFQHALDSSSADPSSDTSEKLARAGIGSADDAIDMIESMSSQLSELYSAQEAMLGQARNDNDGQSTFQQLETLYAEQDKLRRELGVSDADSLIAMVETMSAQLNELYEEREASSTDSGDTQVPDSETASPPLKPDTSAYQQSQTLSDDKRGAGQGKAGTERADDETHATIRMLQEKAESLEAAVERLQDRTQKQEQALEKLEQTQSLPSASNEPEADPPQPVDPESSSSLLDKALQDASGQDTSGDQSPANSEPDATSPAKKSNETSRFELSASDPVFDTEQLNALRTAAPSQWDDHTVGIVQLDDDGTIQYINEAACQLPRLREANPDALRGQNFFTDLALSTNNDLFRGRFEKGTQCNAMQVCFPYTFIAPGYAPKVFNIHMHRSPQSSSNWILLDTP